MLNEKQQENLEKLKAKEPDDEEHVLNGLLRQHGLLDSNVAGNGNPLEEVATQGGGLR
ncbi:hypothetical protein ACQ86N_06400 [Puia sp. P3]|uniref:hypothetical protein n=1 Tax=Puia sp. P3 TaxID=3423952 RepID=UPI003D674A81